MLYSFLRVAPTQKIAMGQHTLKNVNCGWNTKIFFYLETSGGQNSNLYQIAIASRGHKM